MSDEIIEHSVETPDMQMEVQPQNETPATTNNEAVPFSAAEPTITEYVERDARLFVAGKFPDKNVEVTEADLDTFIANHDNNTPIRVEHQSTPFDGALGTFGQLYRKGIELFGKVRFPVAAWGLIKTLPCRSLSVGMAPDKSRLTEASLTNTPRVLGAQVFSDSEGVVGFTSDLPWTYENEGNTQPIGGNTMPDETTNQTIDMSLDKALAIVRAAQPGSEAAELLFKVVTEQAALTESRMNEVKEAAIKIEAMTKAQKKMMSESAIVRFKNEGKITPAAEVYARAILEMSPIATIAPDPAECVTFSDRDGNQRIMHFAEVFQAFLNAMPASVNFRELTRQAEADGLLTSDQRAMNAALGISDDDFRKVHAGGTN